LPTLAALLLALVACGPPAPHHVPPSIALTQQTPPAGLIPMRPACTDATGPCAILHMEYFEKRACACQTKACAETTNTELSAWGTDLAKRASQDEKPDEAIAKRAVAIMGRYTDCVTKLLVTTPPPANPCGEPGGESGGDPCGN
jgi:hypothetical protein